MFESRLKTWRLLLCVLLALPSGLSGGAAQAHVPEAPAPQVAAMGSG